MDIGYDRVSYELILSLAAYHLRAARLAGGHLAAIPLLCPCSTIYGSVSVVPGGSGWTAVRIGVLAAASWRQEFLGYAHPGPARGSRGRAPGDQMAPENQQETGEASSARSEL
jgi:hypothetical protein